MFLEYIVILCTSCVESLLGTIEIGMSIVTLVWTVRSIGFEPRRPTIDKHSSTERKLPRMLRCCSFGIYSVIAATRGLKQTSESLLYCRSPNIRWIDR